jgi:hypothetical protein
MADPKTSSTESNDGGRAERAGANATAQGKNQTNSTATVTVGCKLPHGLILDLTEPGKPQRRYRIRGKNSATVIGGYGITEGVPRDLWEEWVKRHAALDIVRKEFVFALADTASTRDKAKERAELKTGFEEIDPTKPPANVKTLTTNDEVTA